MRKLILILMLAMIPSMSSAQFSFGPAQSAKILASQLPACTATTPSDYTIIDPLDANACTGGAATPYAELNWCVCDKNTLTWKVLVSTIGAGSGAVTSVHGRTGAVVSQTNDYSISQVTGGIASSTLASQANAQGASLIGVEDASGNLVSINVEAALAELFSLIGSGGFTPNADPGIDHSAYLSGHANGANAPAGQAIAGVDASGAFEGAFDVETQVEADAHAANASAHHVKTIDTNTTNLGATPTATTVTITSDTGGGALIPQAGATAGVISAADQTKLDGIQSGAQVDSNAATICATGKVLGGAADGCVAASSGGSVFTQPVPSIAQDNNGIVANTTDPANTSMGFGISYLPHSLFSANTYFGAGDTPAGSEADNQIGLYYNKTGVNGSVVNKFEHAWDWSWETAFRGTASTSDRTYQEHNIDLWPPVNSSVLTSIAGGFDPPDGSVLTFSGGGTGQVISFDLGATNTLVWMQDFGTVDVAATETVTAITGGGTANLGATVTYLGDSSPYQLRARQIEWRPLTQEIVWAWNTDATSANSTLRLQSSGVGMDYSGAIGQGISLSVGGHTSTQPSARIYHQTAGLDSQVNYSANVLDLKQDFSATNTSFNSSAALRILTPIASGSGSTQTAGRRHVIEIQNQLGYGSTSSAIWIDPQSCGGACSGGAGQYGNFTMAGGNWNNGHMAFEDEAAAGDHVWRDQTNEVLRIKTDGTPVSETDGEAFVTGTGSNIYAPGYMAISNGGTFDTGDEVCNQVGGTCVVGGVWNLTGGAVVAACTTTITSTNLFMVMCK